MSDVFPTPRSPLYTGYVWCNACRHQASADPQALIDTGRGDMPLMNLQYRCTNCGSRLTEWVVTSRTIGP
jgi:hypothetical protein